MYSIRLAKESDQTNWQRCFKDSKEKNHSYDWRWKDIIKNVFKHEPLYLIAENEEHNIIGIFPVFHVKSLLFGSALISVPYLNGGGALFSHEVKDKNKVLTLFLEKLISLSQERTVKYFELRSRLRLDSFSSLDILKERTHKVAMSRILAQDPESLFSSFPPKLRSQIRKPTKEGCSTISEQGHRVNPQMINHFYHVYSTNMRDLGIPVYPKELFSETLSSFGKESRLTIVYHNNQAVAAGITIGTSQTLEVLWASSLKKYKKIAPNMLLYWEIMKHAIMDGYLCIDFGRSSKDSGTFKFKEQWGATPDQLHWYYYVSEGDIPEISSQNESMSVLVTMWKYMPLPVSKLIGRYITRSLP